MTAERRRTVFIIAGTLIAGMLIGGLIVAMAARTHYRGGRPPRMENGKGRGSRDEFSRNLFHIIRPDSVQITRMRPIVDSTAAKIEVIQSQGREEVQEVIDSLEIALVPVLRDEQIQRLKDFNRRKRLDGRRR